ncbi:helix-turn-helix domain-containing protein [Tropicibacter sp. R15_0]|uniref:helix-turn-helix domain-containing protein n=1 Tax=Tropicibacter sp. R15_0 TaxID=2821101 RepID=UPI001ADA755B|nr:AraC family transcriptional regulator [Tropicibacter sp. R15_0]MBO9466342.1 helix-turn-helix domain-containing protein [Tropicibacter sp. R15_0]
MTALLKQLEAAGRCLVIPDGLSQFKDATLRMAAGRSSIYSKLIKASALGVEFHCADPCLCYVISGRETFYTADGTELTVKPGEMIFLPANSYMVSDFVNSDGPLAAYLCFFGPEVLSEFERKVPLTSPPPASATAYKLDAHLSLSGYFSALAPVYENVTPAAPLVQAKLLELLLLIATLDDVKRLAGFLLGNKGTPARRNIKHLMREHANHNISVADFARMSGRSVAGFNREFRRVTGQSPGQWLLERRLDRAKHLILTCASSVQEIGQEVGYSNTSHFIAQFQKRFGATPLQMRKARI